MGKKNKWLYEFEVYKETVENKKEKSKKMKERSYRVIS